MISSRTLRSWVSCGLTVLASDRLTLCLCFVLPTSVQIALILVNVKVLGSREHTVNFLTMATFLIAPWTVKTAVSVVLAKIKTSLQSMLISRTANRKMTTCTANVPKAFTESSATMKLKPRRVKGSSTVCTEPPVNRLATMGNHFANATI